ncbi:hypothetical protein LCGC14_2220990 [marine sediment metagenome]|uniref:Uncharacterized protein n=1 Tax=marine sediment metagenome TaxID=412755 RepID=A0A0F9FNJ4_9ZZZZ
MIFQFLIDHLLDLILGAAVLYGFYWVYVNRELLKPKKLKLKEK